MNGSSNHRRRKIVVCTPYAPRLDARHGGKATAQLLVRLAERNDVALLCLRATDEQDVDPMIAALCVEVEVVRVRHRIPRRLAWTAGLVRGLPPWAVECRSPAYGARLAAVIDRLRPDVVEIHFQAMAQYVGVAASRDVPRILVDYDPPSAWADEMRRDTAGPRRLIRRLEVAAWRRYERRTRPRFNAIVVFAERDVREISRDAADVRLVRIPLAVEVPAEPLEATGRGQTVVFVGGFAHPPNVDAAIWLARSLFPRVLERVPGARLELVGHEPPEQIRALANTHVDVHGSVPDVSPYVDRAAIVVAPIRLGGSMRMKVLEALASGKALVATPRAAEGVEAVPGRDFVLAHDGDELVDALSTLLLDEKRRRELARRARSWAEEHLGWTAGVSAFEQLYDVVAEDRAGAS